MPLFFLGLTYSPITSWAVCTAAFQICRNTLADCPSSGLLRPQEHTQHLNNFCSKQSACSKRKSHSNPLRSDCLSSGPSQHLHNSRPPKVRKLNSGSNDLKF